jgi:hypothetical protein
LLCLSPNQMAYDGPNFLNDLNDILGRIAAREQNNYYGRSIEQCQSDLKSRCEAVSTFWALRWQRLLVEFDKHKLGTEFSYLTKDNR